MPANIWSSEDLAKDAKKELGEDETRIKVYLLRYESSTLILYKVLSSSIFQSCQSVSQSVRHA